MEEKLAACRKSLEEFLRVPQVYWMDVNLQCPMRSVIAPIIHFGEGTPRT